MITKTHEENGVTNKMKKLIQITTWLSVLLLIAAVTCVIAYNIIGQKIDEQGFLHESFFLIPMTWLFLLLGVITGGVNLVARIINVRKIKEANS